MRNMVEILQYEGKGFRPLVDYEGWRVAILNDDPSKYRRKTTKYLERHIETDEVFVLLAGECTLYIGGSADTPENISPLTLEPKKIFNVKKGVWHSLIGTPDMVLLIVENSNTTLANSQHYDVTLDMLP